jgi:hypothetical protein
VVSSADITLAILGILAGIVVAGIAARAAPRARALSAREEAKPLAEGPLRQTIQNATDTRALADQASRVSRALLSDALSDRGLAPEKARLAPILQQLLGGGAVSTWWRLEARASYRGPRALFWPWYAMRSITETDEARSLRYIESLGKELDAWMRRA